MRPCPLAVRWESYSATRVRGGIEIAWRTVEEHETLAFLVERAPSPAGPFVALGDPVEALGAGNDYRRLDATAEPGPGAGAHMWYRVVEWTAAGRGDETQPFAADDAAGGGRRRATRKRH